MHLKALYTSKFFVIITRTGKKLIAVSDNRKYISFETADSISQD